MSSPSQPSHPSRPIDIDTLGLHLPERIWYLSSDGTDVFCRRPYSFVFSTATAATAFAHAQGLDTLEAVGIDAKDIGMRVLVGAFQRMHVTRLFVDPAIDEPTGDVFGTIIRFQEPS